MVYGIRGEMEDREMDGPDDEQSGANASPYGRLASCSRDCPGSCIEASGSLHPRCCSLSLVLPPGLAPLFVATNGEGPFSWDRDAEV